MTNRQASSELVRVARLLLAFTPDEQAKLLQLDEQGTPLAEGKGVEDGERDEYIVEKGKAWHVTDEDVEYVGDPAKLKKRNKKKKLELRNPA